MSHPLLPTPPTTHRSSHSLRRELHVSEELLSSNGSTVVVDTTDEFRIGTPSPLRALPLEIYPAESESPGGRAFHEIEFSIIGILHKAEIFEYSVSFLKRCELSADPSLQDQTILIETPKHERWTAVVKEISELLYEQNALDVRVEIIDERATLHYWPPKIDSEFKRIWPDLEFKIISILGLGEQWDTFSLLNRGHTKEDSTPTVTIGVTTVADQEWQKSVYKEIMDLLQQSNTTDVNLAFVRSSFQAAQCSWGRHQPSDAFTNSVPMGSSIGIENKSGTLGGYVSVEYEGDIHIMGLTAHRAIMTDAMTEDEKENGYAPNLNRAQPRISVPSDLDTDATIDKLQQRIFNQRSRLDGRPVDPLDPDGPKQEGQREMIASLGAEASASQLWGLAEMEEDLRGTEEELATVTTALREFGTVFASSGLCRSYGSSSSRYDEKSKKDIECRNPLDWALIRVNEDRIGSNDLPRPDDFPHDVFSSVSMTTVTGAEGTEPIENSSLFKRLFKNGRGGCSAGDVLEFKTNVNLHDGRGYCKAASVLALPRGDRSPRFMSGGDAGCWVLNAFGFVNALGFATNVETSSGYLIPISHIYDDIFRKTGARVVSPKISFWGKMAGATGVLS